jgi:hypothetical protein
MMLHAGVLYVVLQGGLQLSNVPLGVGIAVIAVSFIGHLDVLQAVVWRDLLVLRGKTHAGRLSGGHSEELCMVVLGSRREDIKDAGC